MQDAQILKVPDLKGLRSYGFTFHQKGPGISQ